MKKALVIATVLSMAFVSALFAWNWPWMTKSANKLTLSGSTTVLPLAQKAAEVYMQKNSGADITVRGGGSGVGIAALIDSTTDIADASRPMQSSEIAKAKSKGVNPVGTIICKDGISIVVNAAANSMTDITLEQIKGIYTGAIKNWKDLGGTDMQIVVISRDSSSGTFEVFNEKVLKGAKLREDALMTASNQEVAAAVEKTPGAVGYIGLGFVTDKLKALVVDGTAPSEETVLSGKYELSRPLYMYTNGDPAGLQKDFIDFILSDDGQKIVKEVGYVPLNGGK